ncbi:cytochrome P450 6a9-like [Lutzomyia longipalpis]|uniref:cytochrome P450 6a9-like n=1 Tax=Lutzomyia longipalpis TaxID=7200 RepID=UPI002484259D|nr:cytochrome P450 6a9-like [Lutzomyia longipalpis]
MDCFLILIALVTFVYLGYLWVKKQYRFFKDNGIPYQEPTFPLGNAWGLGYKRPLTYFLQEAYNAFKGKHVIGGIYLFTTPAFLATNLDFIKQVLVKDFQYFHDRGIFVNEKDDPLSGNLFALSGQRWKTIRNKLSPTFTSGKMKLMHSTIIAVAKEFQGYLEPIAQEKKEVEIKDILARFTTDVIGTCAFGIDCNSLKQPDTEFRRIGKMVFEFGSLDFLKQFLVTIFQDLSVKLGVTVTKPEVSEFFMRLLKETTEYREKNNIKRNDFLSLLLQIKNTGKLEGDDTDLGKMTFEELAAQTFLFFIAGFETSSSTMTFALYELAQNQDIQDRAREEIHRILEKYNGEYTYEACMELKYIDQVIQETLRKYPVTDTLIREAVQDYKIPNYEFVIKKKSKVLISSYAIHRDPEIYPNPDKFDPDRFTEDNIKARHPYAWLPFGEGPRICVGMRFGMMQTRVGLANFLSKYRVRTSPKTPIPIVLAPNTAVLTAQGGMWLQVEKV